MFDSEGGGEVTKVRDDECEDQVVFKAEKVLKKTTGVQSLVWKFFHFKGTTKGPDKTKVFCNICLKFKASGKDKSCLSYTGGTTNLKNHLRSFHQKELQEAEKDLENNKQENTKPISDFFGKGAKKQYKWPKSSLSWKRLTMRLTKWLCVNSRPSYLVEDEGFRYFMEMACPEYEVHCSNTINNYIKELYISEKEKIADRLAEAEFVVIHRMVELLQMLFHSRTQMSTTSQKTCILCLIASLYLKIRKLILQRTIDRTRMMFVRSSE